MMHFKLKGLNLRKFALKRIMQLPDTITYLNLLSGLGAIVFSVQGDFRLAASLFLFAIAFDYLDGKVATMLKRKTEFGKQIDSLTDIISFGLAPALFGYMMEPSLWIMISAALFVLCGIIRLARYNVINYAGGFIGMPITVNGLLFPLYYFLSGPIRGLPILFLLSAALMISPFRVRRLP